MFWILISYQIYDFQVFSPIPHIFLHFVDGFFFFYMYAILILKDLFHKVKRQPTKKENIFANCISEMRFVSRTYDELL